MAPPRPRFMLRLVPTEKSETDLKTLLNKISQAIEDMLNPARSRVEIVRTLQSLDRLLNDDDDDDDDDYDLYLALVDQTSNAVAIAETLMKSPDLTPDEARAGFAEIIRTLDPKEDADEKDAASLPPIRSMSIRTLDPD